MQQTGLQFLAKNQKHEFDIWFGEQTDALEGECKLDIESSSAPE